MKRKNKAVKAPKSMKGKKGTVGAPAKPVKYPKTRFTIARVVSMNSDVCELTIRNRIKADVAAGVLAVGDPIPQPKKAVGRPKFTYILTGKVPVVTVKKPRKSKTVRVVDVTNVVTNPAPEVAEPVVNVVVNPAGITAVTATPVEATVAPVEPVTPIALPE